MKLKYRAKIKLIKFYKSYTCKNCNYVITINMDTFQTVEHVLEINTNFEHINCDTIKFDLNKLENLKLKLESNYKFILEINEEDLMEKISLTKKYNQLMVELKDLEIFKPSPTVIKLGKKVEKLKEELVHCNELKQTAENLDVLKDKRRDLTIKKSEILQQIKIKNILLEKIKIDESYDEEEHTKIKKMIENNNELLNLRNIEFEKVKTVQRLNIKFKTLTDELNNLRYDDGNIPQFEQLLKNLELALDYHERIQKYKAFHIQLRKYKKVKDTLNDFIQKKQTQPASAFAI